MKGILHKTEQGWVVRWTREDPRDPLSELQLHPEDAIVCNNYGDYSIDWDGKEVEFDWCVIVDHDTGKGEQYAKLIDAETTCEYSGLPAVSLYTDTSYPESKGTMAICNDINEALTNESVPAPDELQEELRRVRQDKNRHVKANNWELAALYREIEKLLQKGEPKCSNCQFKLTAIGVGQGLICDLNKCRIPHSEHSCQYHAYVVSDATCKNDKF